MVTDVAMPVGGERELAEELSLTRPEMRVLYMSGDTEEDIANTSVIGEQAAVLQKPFAPDALAVKVREVLSA